MLSMDENLGNLEDWLKINEVAVLTYIPERQIDHPILQKTGIINGIVNAIKVGDLNAIELGCNLATNNFKLPFGRALKSNIFSSLKSQAPYISPKNRDELAELAIIYLNLDYPPRECKSLCRLLKRFESKYLHKVISGVDRTTKEAERWKQYLSV